MNTYEVQGASNYFVVAETGDEAEELYDAYEPGVEKLVIRCPNVAEEFLPGIYVRAQL